MENSLPKINVEKSNSRINFSVSPSVPPAPPPSPNSSVSNLASNFENLRVNAGNTPSSLTSQVRSYVQQIPQIVSPNHFALATSPHPESMWEASSAYADQGTLEGNGGNVGFNPNWSVRDYPVTGLPPMPNWTPQYYPNPSLQGGNICSSIMNTNLVVHNNIVDRPCVAQVGRSPIMCPADEGVLYDYFACQVPLELRGCDVVQMAMTEEGSQRLQNLLVPGNETPVNYVVQEICGSIFVIVTSPHGYHLFGKLIRLCNRTQLQLILTKLTSDSESFVRVSLDRYGSRSIIKLIYVLERSPLVGMLTAALSRVFFILMTNRNGSLAILRCIENLDSRQNEVIYIEAIRYCLILAVHERGCISLNLCICYVRGERRLELLYKIALNAVHLANDPSGNYVIQMVIGIGNPLITRTICNLLRGQYGQLSTKKGASHVVEKCLNSSCRDLVIEDLLTSDRFAQVAKDQYGNYVIQTALKVTKKFHRLLHELLLNKIKSIEDELQYGYGRNVLKLIQRGVPIFRNA